MGLSPISRPSSTRQTSTQPSFSLIVPTMLGLAAQRPVEATPGSPVLLSVSAPLTPSELDKARQHGLRSRALRGCLQPTLGAL